MSAPHRQSLYLRVVGPAVLLLVASMATVSYVALMAMQASVRLVAEQRAQSAIAFARNSVEDVEHVMLVGSGLKLQSVIDRIAANPDLEAVRILSPTGRVLHSSRPGEKGLMMPDHLPGGSVGVEGRGGLLPSFVRLPNYLYASGPIRNSQQCRTCHHGDAPLLGYVGVDVNMTRQSSGLRTIGRMALVAGIGQVVVVGVGLVLILGYAVVRPVRRLLAGVDQVEHGNLDVSAPGTGTIEIDRLVTGFNDMVARLRAARETEEENQRTRMVRVEQLATIGEMAASLAHEIRNPLSGVKAAVDVLAAEQQAEEAGVILKHVSDELARVDGVIRQLLNFARPRQPAMTPVDFSVVVGDTVNMSRPRAAAQKTALVGQFPPDPVVALADGEMLQQAVLNLVINALQAVDEREDARVTVEVLASGGRAICRVRDSGPGVPLDRATAIFRPFVTSKPRGTGLGLATSRRLAEVQGGQLHLENPGQPGASFVLSIPLSDGEA